MHLNPAQREAVYTLSGPLLVLAGAGTGKTRVVIHRVAELIRRGVAPEKILAVTFTKKAAGEMLERAGGLLGRKPPQRPQISTFHALCLNILRRQITHLGYGATFAICDRADQEGLARGALRELKVPNESLRPGDLLAIISRWKSSSIRPAQAEAAAGNDRQHLAAMAYRRYQRALQARGAVDFDDLLLLVEDLFTRMPGVRSEEAARFRHLLIDEYQDTNAPQYRIVKALARDHRNLCVVGDDDQSIYGWRGAEVSHILQFTRDWPEAKVVRLEENYRSTGPILQMANQLIAFNRQRHHKVLRSTRAGGVRPRILQFETDVEEARAVAAEIRSQITSHQAAPGDFVILFRTNEQTRPFETELRRSGVKYVVLGGTSFFDRKEVRDILSYLRVIVNPADEPSLLRIINLPPRGIGQGTVVKLTQWAVKQGKPLWEVLGETAAVGRIVNPSASNASTPAASSRGAETPPSVVNAIAAFRGLIESAKQRFDRGPLAGALRWLIDDIGYEQELERTCPDPNERLARWNVVQDVINALAEYEAGAKQPALLGFLDEMTLDPRTDADKESQLRGDAVTLMTLHSAKGLEFPQVYMVGMEEGILPHQRSLGETEEGLEEERRLCYVGMTRAQDRLTLTLPLSRRKWGKLRPTIASRFLFEMTGQAERPNSPGPLDHGSPKKGLTKKATATAGAPRRAPTKGPPRLRR
jgi:DNA helicase-2/ATP-dependent DNA helicase PcrA